MSPTELIFAWLSVLSLSSVGNLRIVNFDREAREDVLAASQAGEAGRALGVSLGVRLEGSTELSGSSQDDMAGVPDVGQEENGAGMLGNAVPTDRAVSEQRSPRGGDEDYTPGLDGDESPTSLVVVTEEDYDYDVEESLKTFNWTELLPALVVYSLTFVFGVAGNFLIIVATTSCCTSGRRPWAAPLGPLSSCCCRSWCCSRTSASAVTSSSASSPSARLQTPSPTNVFLASLASADLLLILICIPVKIAKLFSYTWTMGAFLCKFVYYMQNVSTICSVLTLTAISLERYYAIVHPMKAKYTCTVGQATKIVLAIWMASLLLAVPILFVQVHLRVGKKIPAYWCFRDLDNVELWRFYEVYLLLLILILPTCVMAGAYASICWEIWKVMRRRYHMTGGRQGINPPLEDPLGCNGSSPETDAMMATESIRLSSTKKSSSSSRGSSATTWRFQTPRTHRTNASESSDMESGTVRKVIKMLVIVVVLFVVCWAPVLIDNVLIAYQVLPVLRDSNSSLRHMGNAFHLMSYFNSCINPIIYGFMSKSFRASFYNMLCKCCHRGAYGIPRRNPSTTSRTRTTSVRYTETRTTEIFNPTNPPRSDSIHAHDQDLQDMFD